MTEKVGIVGIGHAKFGKRTDVTLRELAHEAVTPALVDAEINVKDIDASVIGVTSEEFAAQVSPAILVHDYVGIGNKPVFRVEAACATGSAAVRAGWSLVKSGLADVVLVVGVETMTHLGTPEATEVIARAGDTRWEYPFGATFPSYYALMAIAHMHKYGTTREQLSMVSVKNHMYGAMNPYAHIQKTITLEETMKSAMICHPLNLYDCCLISDGAAAVILASEEKAKRFSDTPVWLVGLGAASDTMMISERENLTELKATKTAAERAYRMAGITSSDVDVAVVHDCFTIAEIMAYEDLGFCKKGEGGKFIEEKQSYIGGKTPINVDGGLKSKGHPLGATGVSMTVEITKQLRDEAGKRQVKGAEIGLSHNVGEAGQYCFVHVYSR
ncbi:MAG: thiolase domain-containing protein [Candidatus Bathyarchaeota archaeon]|nr:MAG: thiolase domain-containing protein [Candidatus Bathyarchaeota archaeon]